MRASTLGIAALFSASVAIAPLACSSSDDAPPASTQRAFRGVLVTNDGKGGVFELHSAQAGTATQSIRLRALDVIPLSGSVSFGSDATALLTGTFDPNTNTLRATGTGNILGVPFSLDGEFRNGALTGTFSLGGLVGPLSALPIDVPSLALHCGNFTGGREGHVNLVVGGSIALGVATLASARALPVSGSVSGDALRATYEAGGELQATVTPAAIDGIWRDPGGSGTFATATARCPTLPTGPMSPPPGDAGPGPGSTDPDGGTEGGGPLTAGGIELATSSSFIDMIDIVGDYIVYTGLEDTSVP